MKNQAYTYQVVSFKSISGVGWCSGQKLATIQDVRTEIVNKNFQVLSVSGQGNKIFMASPLPSQMVLSSAELKLVDS